MCWLKVEQGQEAGRRAQRSRPAGEAGGDGSSGNGEGGVCQNRVMRRLRGNGREWPRVILSDLFEGGSTWLAKGDSNVTDFDKA